MELENNNNTVSEDTLKKENEQINKEDLKKEEEINKQEPENKTDDKINEENNDISEQSQEDENLIKMQKLEKEANDMKELAQRTQAEFMNYKKRTAKEMQDMTVFANEKIMTELLSVLDNFDRALNSGIDSEDPFHKGVELIKKELENVLFKSGLEEIDALGKDFDPNYHHAVMQEAGDEPNKVLEVLQKGYKLKEKVIRPAMVKVSQ